MFNAQDIKIFKGKMSDAIVIELENLEIIVLIIVSIEQVRLNVMMTIAYVKITAGIDILEKETLGN